MRIPEFQHIVQDANGWDYYQIFGQIRERNTYRVMLVEEVWRVEFWNGYGWVEVVVLSDPVQSSWRRRSASDSTEAAIALAHRIVTGWGSDE